MDYLVSWCPEIVYTCEGKTNYNINLLVSTLKEKDHKQALDLGTSRQVFACALSKGIFSKEDEEVFKKVSDKLGKFTDEKKLGINTTLEHSKDSSRNINHRLYRIEKSLNFLKEHFSNVQKKDKKVVKSKQVDAVKKSVDDSWIKLLGEEISILSKTYGDRISALEKQNVKLKDNISNLEEQLKEIRDSQIAFPVTPNNVVDVNEYKPNKEGYRKMYPDEVTKAKYVVDNMDKLNNLSENQRNCLESLKAQIYGSNGANVRTASAGLGIVRDCYSRLTESSSTNAYTNGGCN